VAKAEPPEIRVDLTDDFTGTPRTTMTLLASLAVRVRTLPLLDGAQAVGSLVAGVAAVGRRVASTAEGARIHQALAKNRVGFNGTALWAALGLDATTSALPPRPVYDDLRNDIALLLAPDLLEHVEQLDEAQVTHGIGSIEEPEDVDFLDFMVGLWFLACEVTAVIEGFAAPGDRDDPPTPPEPGPEGMLLR
jgi:hypothetical protein